MRGPRPKLNELWDTDNLVIRSKLVGSLALLLHKSLVYENCLFTALTSSTPSVPFNFLESRL